MCSITGVGERLHEVLGQIDLGKLDSGERSLPFGLLVMNSLDLTSQTSLLIFAAFNFPHLLMECDILRR